MVKRTLFFLLPVIWPISVSAGGHAQILRPRHDPFVRPAMLTASRLNKSAAASVSKPTLQLNGVLNAGRNSMVNIDGTIVRLHEEYSGYTLTAVLERSAVLEKNGQQVILQMDRDQLQESNQ